MNNQSHSIQVSQLKLHHPQRMQVEFKQAALDDLVPPQHKARAIWDCVQSMNTAPCFRQLKSQKYCRGRGATNPEVLFGLWMLALTDGVVSSRVILELTEMHDAYKWMRGGVPLNHDMLCKFRSQNPMVFEDLLVSSLALLQSHNLLSDDDFAQDGTRVQSAAGRSSGRREKTLLKYREEALQRLKDLTASGGASASTVGKREQVTRRAAAKQRKERMDMAVFELEKARETKLKSCRKKKSEIEKEANNVRISPTDPESRKMKMGNGGFSFAYNVQVVTGAQSRAIYAISVSNSSDQGKAPRQLAKTISLAKQLGLPKPKNWLADSGYSTRADIEGCHALLPSCNTVIAPKQNKKSDPKKIKKTDGPGIRKWKAMLGSDEFKATYSLRCSTVELSNARLKKCGLSRFSMSGLRQAASQALLVAITHNILIVANALA